MNEQPTSPKPEPLAELKNRLAEQIEYTRQNQEIDLQHAKNYAYTALLEFDAYSDESYRERERAAIRRAFFHDGRANGHAMTIGALVDLQKQLEAINEQQ